MERVGEYEYNPKDLIGHGAFAVVYKGRHRKNHNGVVAIKSITKKNLSKSQNLLGKEIKILKELTELHHENVVALLDCKETPIHVFLVMEYCNNGDLADYLQRKGTLSEDTIRLFLRQLAGAMKALNAKGIVHRDLKPQNILLCHSGEKPHPAPHEIMLKIADFGFARFLQQGVMAATLCGSPMYMAPEVIMSLQYDAKADLWSIGTIVFQCLTGKAPFQAQTPQALKQFYEKNVNLTPKIPSGTSSELSDLLVKLLKRNAKDRMEFDEFFCHHFLKKIPKPTSPVPVPVRQHSIPREISPVAKKDSPSPYDASSPPDECDDLPGDVMISDMARASPNDQERFATLDVKGQGSPTTEGPDGFVIVPPLLPTETFENVATGFKRKSTETFGSSPMMIGTPPKMSSSPSTGLMLKRYSSPLESPSPRPSYLPVNSSPSSGGGSIPSVLSQPIPVPSQKAAYYQIQQSLQGSPISESPLPAATSNSPDSPSRNAKAHLDNYNANISVPRSAPVGMGNGSQESVHKMTPDLSSFTPPSVPFMIGTPPLLACRTNSVTPPPNSPWPYVTPPYFQNRHIPNSPVRKSSILNSSPNSNYFFGANYGSNFAALTEISDNLARNTPSTIATGFTCNPFPTNMAVPDFNNGGILSPSQPLVIPFGTRESAAGLSVMETSASSAFLQRSGSSGRISEALSGIRAVFSNQGGILFDHHGSSCRAPYGSAHDDSSALGAAAPLQGAIIGGLSSLYGHIFFVPPELPEETIMDKEHNEILAKLNFISTLVSYIMELALSRSNVKQSTALAESTMYDFKQNKADEQPATMLSGSCKRAEQLVLYYRALQLLSAALNLSREELKNGRLQPSAGVKNVVTVMNKNYHDCLTMCKNLNSPNLLKMARNDPRAASITAEKLLYNYAIEICQTGAMEEIMGDYSNCMRRYEKAHLLLHSLTQQINNENDRGRLNKYKQAVEKRLFILKDAIFNASKENIMEACKENIEYSSKAT